MKDLQEYFDSLVKKYEGPSFIENDPICVPHSYSSQVDVEISGFFAAIFAWGQRKTIINKSKELMHMMDNAPGDFILHHSVKDLQALSTFKHRTFQYDDLLYFIHFLHHHYTAHKSLESAFVPEDTFTDLESSLNYFNSIFFSLNHLNRTRKHIPLPASGSTCKRLCMYLRWMVRSNKKGVDFGMWKKITSKDLMMPLDVHVHRIAVQYNLLDEKQRNWKAVKELTQRMKSFDPEDPVRYDFALFNLGVRDKDTFPAI